MEGGGSSVVADEGGPRVSVKDWNVLFLFLRLVLVLEVVREVLKLSLADSSVKLPRLLVLPLAAGLGFMLRWSPHTPGNIIIELLEVVSHGVIYSCSTVLQCECQK